MTSVTADKTRTTADADPTGDAGPESARPANVWVVRADQGKYIEHFVRGGYIATEWELADLSSVGNLDDLRRRYNQACPDANARQKGVNIAQMAAFHLHMREGDYVVTPTDDTEWLRYGRVTGATVYAAADDGCRYPNRRSVDWATTPLRRHDLPESLQKTLGSVRTVFAVIQREEFLAAIEQPDLASDRAGVSPRMSSRSNRKTRR